MATLQGIRTANVCGKLDNSYVFVASFPSSSAEQMHTYSNKLIPLREKKKPKVIIIFIKTTLPPPSHISLKHNTDVHVCCAFEIFTHASVMGINELG